MLSDVEIQKSILSGDIKIEPFNPKSLEPSCYNVTLHSKLLELEDGQTIDLNGNDDPRYREVEIGEGGYYLEPKGFVLGSTVEQLSTSRSILTFIDGSSTLARIGLSIHQTAFSLKPGQPFHTITLEIFNASNSRIVLHKGMRIGKFLFFKSNLPNSEDYTSKYTGQIGAKGAVISDLKEGI